MLDLERSTRKDKNLQNLEKTDCTNAKGVNLAQYATHPNDPSLIVNCSLQGEECKYWRDVPKRVMDTINFLAQLGLAFIGVVSKY